MLRFSEFILQEGGNALSTPVVRINQANSLQTIQNVRNDISQLLQIPVDSIQPVGSSGKKGPNESSGDLDMAVDVGQSTIAGFIQDNIQKLRSRFGETSSLFGYQVSIPYQIVNVDGKQPNQKVQVDLMFCNNMNATQFGFYSAPYGQSKYKGLYRNQLLYSIVNSLKEQQPNGDVERYWFDQRQGLLHGTEHWVAGKRVSVDKSIVTGDPNVMVRMLLGPEATVSDAATVESLLSFMRSNKFIFRDRIEWILNDYKHTLVDDLHLIPPAEV